MRHGRLENQKFARNREPCAEQDHANPPAAAPPRQFARDQRAASPHHQLGNEREDITQSRRAVEHLADEGRQHEQQHRGLHHRDGASLPVPSIEGVGDR